MKRYLITATVAIVCAVALFSCNRGMKRVDRAEFSGKDVTAIARVVRAGESRAAKLIIDKNIEWELYAGRSVESIEFGAPIAKGDKAGEYDLALPEGGVRYYFQLITNRGNAILAERLLPMEGGYNFRDLGGIRTKEKRYVKWGKLFRTDGLDKLTDGDLDYLSSIPIRSVVDFRYDAEVENAPSRIPQSVENVYGYGIKPGSFDEFIESVGDNPQREDMVQEMKNLNIRLVTRSEIVKQYKRFFELLLVDEAVPLMFHCSAGKDRTGFAAAMILYSLGVDWEVIIDDYLASNVHLDGKYDDHINSDPAFESLWMVNRKYIEAGIKQIIEDHGSLDYFIDNVLEVDREQMKEKFLYPAK